MDWAYLFKAFKLYSSACKVLELAFIIMMIIITTATMTINKKL